MSKKSKIIFSIAIAVIVIAIVVIIIHLAGKAKRAAIYDEIRPTETAHTVVSDDGKYESPIDFAAMKDINEDIYAWITIPDTTIDYPIVQGTHEDNVDYYLDHTIEHAEGFPGSIYTRETDNTKTFEEFNTLIYGHELADNTMFTPLHNYMDPEYFNTHREIKIYLPEKELTYKVFAAVTYDDRLIPYYYDNNDETARKSFLESIYNNRYLSDNIADDITVTENDQIITLSTCLYDLPDNRYLVLAVKTGETPAE